MKSPKANTRGWEHLNNAKLIRYLLLFALAWAIVQVLAYFETVLVVFIFAAILAFLLNYPVRWVSRWMPRWLAVLIVFLMSLLVIGGAIATLGLTIISQAQQLLGQAPQLLESAIDLLENLQTFLNNRNITVDFSALEVQLREQALSVIGTGTKFTLRNLVEVSCPFLLNIQIVPYLFISSSISFKVMKQHTYLPSPNISSRMTMGLKPLLLEDWIEIDENFILYLSYKRQLLEHRYSEVFAALPGSQSAQNEVLELLIEHLSNQFPQYYSRQGTQIKNLITQEVWCIEGFKDRLLDLAGRLVQEDLCLMQCEAGRYVLRAASLCFPQHWRLDDKLGKSVSQIHGPVPGYPENLAHPVDSFFSRLKADSPVYRVNWGIADTPELFMGHPPSEIQKLIDPSITVDNIGEKLWIRVERQTLRKLEKSKDVLFTIRTYLYPVSVLKNDPIAARNLEEVINQTSPDMQAYKNVSPFREILFSYLEIIQKQ